MPGLRKSLPALLLCVAALLLIIPLWLVHAPAMPDYPARLADLYLIDGGERGSLFYDVRWAAIPNLASEVLVPLLARAMPLETALRLFLSLAVTMWVAGPALIHRALYNRMGLTPLAASLFAFNINFHWGFFNYYFATGLCLVFFAGWIAGSGLRRMVRLALFVPATLILYFCHVLAAALFLLLVACYEMAEKPHFRRKLFVDLAVLAAPAGLFFLFKPGEMHGAIAFNLIGTFLPRLESLVQWRFSAPAYPVLAGLAVFLAWGFWNGALCLHPRLRVAMIVLTLVALVAPEVAMGGWGLHLRFPAVAAALLFAASDLAAARQTAAAISAGLLVSIGGSSAALASYWHEYDRQIAEFRSALSHVPEGQRLMTVVSAHNDGPFPTRLFWHIAEFAITDRNGFSALMFTTKGQHIIAPKPEAAPHAARTARDGTPPDSSELAALDQGDGRLSDEKNEFPYLADFACYFDLAVFVRPGGGTEPMPSLLKPVWQGSFFTLYRVERPPGCSTISATRP